MTALSDRRRLGEPILRRALSPRTFVNVYGWDEWWFRIRGWGLSIQDHRKVKPLYTERYRRRRQIVYLHVGPYCLRAFGPKSLPAES